MNPGLHHFGEVDGRDGIGVLFVCHAPMCAQAAGNSPCSKTEVLCSDRHTDIKQENRLNFPTHG
jgi:hypothetical protein